MSPLRLFRLARRYHQACARVKPAWAFLMQTGIYSEMRQAAIHDYNQACQRVRDAKDALLAYVRGDGVEVA